MQVEDIKNTLSQESSSEIDIKEILFIFLSKWYWFVISVIILLLAGFIYLKRQAPVYETKMSVLVKQEENAPEEMLLLKDLGLSGGKNNIDNEIGVFKSPDLVTKIVISQELFTTYHRDSKLNFYNPELYKSSPLYVRLENVKPDSISTKITLTINKDSKGYNIESEFHIDGEDISETSNIRDLPGFVELKIGKLYLAKQEGIEFGEGALVVEIQNAAVVAREIIKNLSVSPSTKLSSLLDLTLKTENRKKGEDILNAIVAEYNKDAIADKNMVSYNTAVFIEERLKDISRELGEVEVEVESFRKQNQITDIPTQAEAYLTRNEGYEKKRTELETHFNLIKYIETFISNPTNKN
ncbi:MAG: Wzz/FepE/Etk N-terminal domain-containing protein, partial [Bacteroidales bacterium]